MGTSDRPPEAQRFIEREIDAFSELLARKNDLVPETLRVHLTCESQLDRIIGALLPRGRRLLKKEQLRFPQKIGVVEALVARDDAVFACLRQLNSVRNSCVHDREKTVGIEDLDKIGQPLGQEYTKLRQAHANNVAALAMAVFGAIFGRLSLFMFRAENRRTT